MKYHRTCRLIAAIMSLEVLMVSFVWAHESFVVQKIGPKGGQVALANGRVAAIIPPNSVDSEIEFRIEESTKPVKPRPDALPVVTHVYRFQPDLQLKTPAKIRFYCQDDCPKIDPDSGGWDLTIGRLSPNGKVHIEPDSDLPKESESFGQRSVPEEKYVELSTIYWQGTRLLIK